MQEILLSICCATYGHERYIRQALDSILMQKVNFRYEVIVGEDCSPDGSRAILKEYEARYPDVFVMMYHDTNLGAKENLRRIYERTRGRYFICLELDDYWTDENKLQIQVDYLEAHPDVLSVSHRCTVVDADGMPMERMYPECPHERYTEREYIRGYLPGHTATNMYRNHYMDSLIDDSFIRGSECKLPGDQRRAVTMAMYGRTVCLPRVMSAYRYQSTPTSYSASAKVNYKRLVEDRRLICCFADRFGKKKRRSMNKLYFAALAEYAKTERSEESIRTLLTGIKEIDNLPACILYKVYMAIRRRILALRKIRYI